MTKGVFHRLSSVGDPALAPLVDAWFADFGKGRTDLEKGLWEHRSQDAAIPALLLRLSDIAPMTRLPTATERLSFGVALGPDGFDEPLMLQVGHRREQSPVYLAVRKADGLPLPLPLHAFLSHVLSSAGQATVGAFPNFLPLTEEEAAAELARIGAPPLMPENSVEPYQPAPVGGPLCSAGAVQFRSLMEDWLANFRAAQPEVARGETWIYAGSSLAIPALISSVTQLAPTGRHPWRDEAEAFRSVRPDEELMEIAVARGGRLAKGKTRAHCVYVHADNPIASLTLAELDAVFGGERRRGFAASPRRWGDLGVTGRWAAQPLRPLIDERKRGVVQAFREDVLLGGAWRDDVAALAKAPALALADEPGAIVFDFAGKETEVLRPLPIAFDAASRPVHATDLDIAAGRYPLSRDIYMLARREAGRPLPPQIDEFLRFMLSREGQSLVSAHGFFPLTAPEIAAQLAKLGPDARSHIRCSYVPSSS